MLPPRVSLSALLPAVAACNIFGSGQQLSHAAAWFVCGPADGPATAIVLAPEPVQLAQPAYPLVQIVILRDVSAIARTTWNLAGDSAYATYVLKQGTTDAASFGTVTITSVDSAKTIRGRLSATFRGRPVATEFTAVWLQNRVLCG